MRRDDRALAAQGHRYLRMSTKMNRYDLGLRDVGKRSLYVEKQKASKLQSPPASVGAHSCGPISFILS